MVFTVTGGEILNINVGAAGAAGTVGYNGSYTRAMVVTQLLSGATTGPIFTLQGGSGAGPYRW